MINLRVAWAADVGFRLLVASVLATAGVATATASLFWTATDSQGAYLIRANDDGSNPAAIVSGVANIQGPNGLEFFDGWLYWPDQQLNAVQRARPDGSGVVTVTTAQNPYDVFATPTEVFWSSQQRNYIDTMPLDGPGYQRLFDSASVTQPFAVAVTATHIYWSEVSGSGRIRRANLDGSGIVTLVPSVYVYDLQVTANAIYFADNNFPGGIKRADLDGTQVTTLLSTGALYHGLCVTEDAIYWAAFLDGEGGGIRRANLDGGNPVSLYNAPPGTSVRGVVVLPDTPVAVQPRLTSYRLDSAGFVLSVETEAGRRYGIEASNNLTDWTEITNLTAASTLVTVTNAVPVGGAQRFFRARTP